MSHADKRETALSMLVEVLAGRMRMVRDRLRATQEPEMIELAQELDDVLPAKDRQPEE